MPAPARSRSCRATTCPTTAMRHPSGLLALADFAVGAATRDWLAEHVTFVSTSVDRITPRTTAADVAAVAAADRVARRCAGRHRAVPRLGALRRASRAGRPAWERAGARFVDDIDPFERRKLWLLNGAHTLLAYAGAARGHRTVAEAIGDPDVPLVGRAVLGRGGAAPARRGPRSRRLSCGAARPLRQRAGSSTCSARSARTARRSCGCASPPCCAPSAPPVATARHPVSRCSARGSPRRATGAIPADVPAMQSPPRHPNGERAVVELLAPRRPRARSRTRRSSRRSRARPPGRVGLTHLVPAVRQVILAIGCQTMERASLVQSGPGSSVDRHDATQCATSQRRDRKDIMLKPRATPTRELVSLDGLWRFALDPPRRTRRGRRRWTRARGAGSLELQRPVRRGASATTSAGSGTSAPCGFRADGAASASSCAWTPPRTRAWST